MKSICKWCHQFVKAKCIYKEKIEILPGVDKWSVLRDASQYLLITITFVKNTVLMQ